MDRRLRRKMLDECYHLNQTEKKLIPDYWIVFESKKLDLAFALDDIVFECYHLSLAIALVYALATILALLFMKKREAFRMKRFTACWYGTLSILNTLTLMRVAPRVLLSLEQKGFYVSLCIDKTFVCDPVSAFWAVFFPYLKILELGDIFILALRKRPVTLFVWTHHLLALIASWHMYPHYPSIGLWYIVIISVPHVLIYVYLFFKELNVAMSKVIPASILMVELITQFLGSIIGVFALSFEINGQKCTPSSNFIALISAMWTICVILCTIVLVEQCRKYLSSGVRNKTTRL